MEAESSNTHTTKQRLNLAVDFPIIKFRRRPVAAAVAAAAAAATGAGAAKE
jgi:hypothetical protein